MVAIGPAQSGGLQQHNAPASGFPSRVLIPAKLPAAANDRVGAGGHVAPGQLDHQDRQPAAQRDRRGLRPYHGAQTQARHRRHQDAGQLGGQRHAAWLKAVSGRVTSPTGQVPDDRPDNRPGHRQRQQWPPGWCAMETQILGQVGEHPRLDVGDQLEQPVDQYEITMPRTAARISKAGYFLVRKTAKGSFGVVTDIASPSATASQAPAASFTLPRIPAGRR